MNDLESKWLESNVGKHEVLVQALENGFVLYELSEGVLLVWGKDSVALERHLEVTRVNSGALAYRTRAEGLGWDEVASRIGYTAKSNACLVAKRHARQKGLPWPPV